MSFVALAIGNAEPGSCEVRTSPDSGSIRVQLEAGRPSGAGAFGAANAWEANERAKET
jgi:hypothetical protein